MDNITILVTTFCATSVQSNFLFCVWDRKKQRFLLLYTLNIFFKSVSKQYLNPEDYTLIMCASRKDHSKLSYRDANSSVGLVIDNYLFLSDCGTF